MKNLILIFVSIVPFVLNGQIAYDTLSLCCDGQIIDIPENLDCCPDDTEFLQVANYGGVGPAFMTAGYQITFNSDFPATGVFTEFSTSTSGNLSDASIVSNTLTITDVTNNVVLFSGDTTNYEINTGVQSDVFYLIEHCSDYLDGMQFCETHSVFHETSSDILGSNTGEVYPENIDPCNMTFDIRYIANGSFANVVVKDNYVLTVNGNNIPISGYIATSGNTSGIPLQAGINNVLLTYDLTVTLDGTTYTEQHLIQDQFYVNCGNGDCDIVISDIVATDDGTNVAVTPNFITNNTGVHSYTAEYFPSSSSFYFPTSGGTSVAWSGSGTSISFPSVTGSDIGFAKFEILLDGCSEPIVIYFTNAGGAVYAWTSSNKQLNSAFF